MQETVITVRGEFSDRFPAERAMVQVDVAFDGPERQSVFESASRAAETVRSTISALYNAESGPVTHWTADSVRVWSERPWNAEGAQLPLIFHSRIGLSARFSDFASLSRWIEDVLAVDGVQLTGIEWALTASRTTTVTAEVRSRAVKDAVSKATIYAQSIGLGTVRAIALADPGMLGERGAGANSDAMHRTSAAMMKSGTPELSLKPESIEISAVVDARFLAS
jgi:uncharacterized protein YggE